MGYLFYCINFLNIIVISSDSGINPKNMAGFYTDGLENVEVVVPEKVTKEGAFVSHYLPHYYDVMSRPKRDSLNAIHFTVPINGKKHHLELWPHHTFLSPGLVIERRDVNAVENINAANFKKLPRNQCHYSGQVIGQPKTRAALSTCNGLVGYIKLPNEEFLIEPIRDSKPIHGEEHPHIIYKRSDQNKKSKSNCGTHGSARSSFNERIEWESLNSRQGIDDIEDILSTNTGLRESESKISGVKSSNREKSGDFSDEFNSTQATARKSTMRYPLVNDIYKYSSDNNQSSKFDSKEKNYKSKNDEQIQNYKEKQKNAGQMTNLRSESSKPESISISALNKDKNGVIKQGRLKPVQKYPLDNFKLNNELNGIEDDVNMLIPSVEKEETDIEDNNLFKIPVESSIINEDKPILYAKELQNNQMKQNLAHSPEEDHIILKQMNKDNTQLKDLDKIKQGTRIKRSTEHLVNLNSDNVKEDSKQKKTRNIFNTVDNSINDLKYDEMESNSEESDKVCHEGKIKVSKDQVKKYPKSGETEQVNLNANYDSVLSVNEKKEKDYVQSYSDNIRLTREKQFDNNKQNINDLQSEVDPEQRITVKGGHFKTEKKDNFEENNVKCCVDVKAEPSVNKIQNTNENIKAANVHNTPDKKVCIQRDAMSHSKNINVKRDTNSSFEQSSTASIVLEKDNNTSQSNPNTGNGIASSSSPNIGNASNSISEVTTVKTLTETVMIAKGSNAENTTATGSKLDSSTVDINSKDSKNFATESIMYETPCIVEKEDTNGPQSENVENEDEQENVDNAEYINDYDRKLEDVDVQINNMSNDGVEKIENNEDELVSSENSEPIKDEKLEEEKIECKDNKIKRKVKNNQKSQTKLSNLKQNVGCMKNMDKSLSNDQAEKAQGYLNDETVEMKDFANSPKEDAKDLSKNKASINDEGESEADDSESKDTVEKDNIMSVADYIQKGQEHCDDNYTIPETTKEPVHCNDYYAKQFNIELMVTVDQKVMELHAEDDIEIFILTIVNMVASNFYDASMGVNMNVALVRLILLTNCIKQLDVEVYSPSEVLENFCAWQVQINPSKDSHPNHHDLAIFVTRMQQCEGEVLGVAYMTSLCRPDKSCIVCVDEGLLLANIMTHQIGHSLGAEHDEGQNNGCPDSEPDGTTYHMGPNIKQISSEWSTCSRETIIQFIKSRASWCLSDSPTDHDFNFPIMLPGQIYSAAQQCKLNFQMYSSPCTVGTFCEKLYCQISPTECVTKGEPPADGTFCATDMWCFNKDCVTMGRRPGAINGEWSKWSEWTQCTRTCGGGVSMSYRICNNPKPSKGGRYCVGKRIRHKMCSTMACQGFTQSFRDLQCKKTEGRPFRGRYHNWQRYHSYFNNIECSLVCQNRKGEVVMRSPVVVDGTPCKPGTRNVCIQGSCVNVGCDWVIESSAKEDACGICHGNGTGCRIIHGTFEEPSKDKTIVPFLTVPVGSGMIFVREVAPSYNLIAVSGAINKMFYLNGLGKADDAMPGDMVFGLTHGTYEVRSNMERIFIRGPTTEPLIFHAIFNDVNSGIRYQYAIPDVDPSYMPRFQWQFIDWDACSDPCSGGVQRSRAKCVEDRGGVVDDAYCIINDRPRDVIRPCNDFPCQAKWWVSIWSDCICTGTSSQMFRSVLCMRSRDEDATRAEVVRDSECSDHAKPVSHRPCNESDTITDCSKRSIKSDNPCGSNMSQSNMRPFRSVSPKLYPIKHSALQKNISHGTPASKSESTQGNATKTPIRERSFNNMLGERNPPLYNLVNDLPSRTLNKVIGAADKLQKHIYSNPLGNRKPSAVVNKGVNRNQLNERFGGNVPTKLNVNGTVGVFPKTKLQSNANDDKNISNTQNKYLQNKFEKNNMENEDEDAESDTNKSEENTESNEMAEQSSSMSGSRDELCGTTTKSSGPCETAPPSTPSTTTCMNTLRPAPHKKTTCCKKIPLTYPSREKMKDVITEEPVVTKVDELNLNRFGLTVIPIESPSRKLPQTDAESSNLGEIGLYSVGSHANGSMVMGQEALDILEKARDNATLLPVIQHEEVGK